MALEHRVPDSSELRLAFHPKLYHASVAAILYLTGDLNTDFFEGLDSQVEARLIRTRIANLVSCLAGIGTLLILMRWLSRLEVSNRARVVVFALFALNTKMIAISSQATNDSFVIFFSSLSLYQGYLFFERPTLKRFLFGTGAAVLAGLSKGNGLVIPLTYLCVFLGLLARPLPSRGLGRSKVLVWAGVFVSLYLATVPTLGPYLDNHRRSGSAFAAGFDPPPLPDFLNPTEVKRPGIRSVAEGLFTFRFIGMLREPMITNHTAFYPLHRTSLWSQLYGRLYFTHFDQWPPSWQTRSSFIRSIGRLALLVALLPTLLWVIGIVREGRGVLRRLAANRSDDACPAELMMAVAMYGFLAFSVAYALYGRDFSVLKIVFIFPGSVAFAWCCARTYDLFRLSCDHAGRRWLVTFDTLVVLLCSLHVVEIGSLIYRIGGRLV